MEADCIFWVVSTDTEPDSETILNLEKFSTKMLPIINVWQCEREDIYSVLQPEEIKDMLLNQFGAYFASAEDPVFYYAKEIDTAQQEHREIKEEWGKLAFTDKVEEIISNIQTGDRMLRIKKQIAIALQTCENSLKDILESPELISLRQTEKNEGHEIKQTLSKLRKARELANAEIKDHAKKSSQEIIDIFSEVSDAFIENQMQGMNWKALFNKKRFQEDMKRDFEKNYVKIKSGWLDNIVAEFSDDVMNILQGIYTDFSMELENTSDRNYSFNMAEDDLSGFIDSMVTVMGKDMANRIAPTVIAAIGAGIMLLIPGGAIFEALCGVVVGGIGMVRGLPKDEKLRSKITGIKNASRVQIKQQRATIVLNMSEVGKEVNASFYEKINDELDKRSNSNKARINQLSRLESDVKSFIAFICEQGKELSNI